MADSFDDVACTSFAFGTDHGRTLTDPTQSLSETGRTTDERHFEITFVYMDPVIGGSEYFGLVDIVDRECFEDLGFDEVSDPYLCHDRHADSLLDLLNQFWVAHTGDTAITPYIARYAL